MKMIYMFEQSILQFTNAAYKNKLQTQQQLHFLNTISQNLFYSVKMIKAGNKIRSHYIFLSKQIKK